MTRVACEGLLGAACKRVPRVSRSLSGVPHNRAGREMHADSERIGRELLRVPVRKLRVGKEHPLKPAIAEHLGLTLARADSIKLGMSRQVGLEAKARVTFNN